MLTRPTWARTKCSPVDRQPGTSVSHSDDTLRRISRSDRTRSVVHTIKPAHPSLRRLHTRYSAVFIVCKAISMKFRQICLNLLYWSFVIIDCRLYHSQWEESSAVCWFSWPYAVNCLNEAFVPFGLICACVGRFLAWLFRFLCCFFGFSSV